MTRATLLALAERVEAATGADRELDGLVFAHMNPDKRVIIGQKPGRFPQDPIYGGPLDIIWIDGFADVLGAPRYTASLDAAMSLVPSGLILRNYQSSRFVPHSCEVALSWAHGGWLGNSDHSFALALTAACLRARAIAGSLPND